MFRAAPPTSADSGSKETVRLHASLEEGMALLKGVGQSLTALLPRADAGRDKGGATEDGAAEDSALRALQQALNESRRHEKETEQLLDDALNQLSAMQCEVDTSRSTLVSPRNLCS